MQRFSKNREAIISCLKGTKTHPTAEWVYAQLKPEYPSLSLATVYRNLTQLKDDGAIQSIGTVLGKERFDGDTSPHTHVVCTRCGRVVDLFDVPVPSDLSESVKEKTCFDIFGADLKFYGECSECKGK